MKIELLHPITHGEEGSEDGPVVYGRGVHDFPEELARKFLALRDPISKAPIAREANTVSAGPPPGTKEKSPDVKNPTPREKEKK